MPFAILQGAVKIAVIMRTECGEKSMQVKMRNVSFDRSLLSHLLWNLSQPSLAEVEDACAFA